MNRNSQIGLALVLFANPLLFVGRFIGRTADPHLLFGLSSSFWAGVLMGVGIVTAAAGIAWMVFGLYERQQPGT